MNLQLVVLLVAGSAAAYYLSQFLFSRDTAVENRRREAIDLSTWCSSNGLPLISKALTEYSVGNYSGLIHILRDLRSTVGDPEAANAAVERFLKVQLDKRLDTAEGREALLTYVEKKFSIEIPREVINGFAAKRKLTEEPVVVADAQVTQ